MLLVDAQRDWLGPTVVVRAIASQMSSSSCWRRARPALQQRPQGQSGSEATMQGGSLTPAPLQAPLPGALLQPKRPQLQPKRPQLQQQRHEDQQRSVQTMLGPWRAWTARPEQRWERRRRRSRRRRLVAAHRCPVHWRCAPCAVAPTRSSLQRHQCRCYCCDFRLRAHWRPLRSVHPLWLPPHLLCASCAAVPVVAVAALSPRTARRRSRQRQRSGST